MLRRCSISACSKSGRNGGDVPGHKAASRDGINACPDDRGAGERRGHFGDGWSAEMTRAWDRLLVAIDAFAGIAA